MAYDPDDAPAERESDSEGCPDFDPSDDSTEE